MNNQANFDWDEAIALAKQDDCAYGSLQAHTNRD